MNGGSQYLTEVQSYNWLYKHKKERKKKKENTRIQKIGRKRRGYGLRRQVKCLFKVKEESEQK